jgi:hypothetical protein
LLLTQVSVSAALRLAHKENDKKSNLQPAWFPWGKDREKGGMGNWFLKTSDISSNYPHTRGNPYINSILPGRQTGLFTLFSGNWNICSSTKTLVEGRVVC